MCIFMKHTHIDTHVDTHLDTLRHTHKHTHNYTRTHQGMSQTHFLRMRLNILTTSRVSFNTGATGCEKRRKNNEKKNLLMRLAAASLVGLPLSLCLCGRVFGCMSAQCISQCKHKHVRRYICTHICIHIIYIHA